MENECVDLLYEKKEPSLTTESPDSISLQSLRNVSSRYSSTCETRCWGVLDVEFEEVTNGAL